MEVWSYGMFKKMGYEVSGKNQKGSIFFPQVETGRNDFKDRGGQHKSGAKGHEVFKVRPVPISLDDDGAAKHVRGSGGGAQQEAEENRVHERVDDSRKRRFYGRKSVFPPAVVLSQRKLPPASCGLRSR